MAEPGTLLGELQAGMRRFAGLRWWWHALLFAVLYIYVVVPATLGVPALTFLGLLATIAVFVLLRMVPKPPRSETVARPRYCRDCGMVYDAGLEQCPSCAAASVSHPTEYDLPALAATLDWLAGEYRLGRIDYRTFNRLRTIYEPKLLALRAEVTAVPAVLEGPAVAPPPAVAETPQPIEAPPPVPAPAPPAPLVFAPAEAPGTATAEPPSRAAPAEPVTPFGETVVAWAAERQADILLYLGAFLVSVAAIIFVAYQGEAVSPIARVAILAVYTIAFLALGILLHHWERAREAGPVFLALGAILVPIDFAAALRVDLLEDRGIPADVLWLTGSSASAALYSLLALRGYGRYYVVPTVPAGLVAWGSLGSVINLPFEWFGAWFELAAAALYVSAATGRLPLPRLVRTGAIIVGASALLFANVFAFSDEHHGQLPVTWALVTIALGGELRFRRSLFALALLPLTSAAAAMATAWAAADPAPAWHMAFLAAAGNGYLLIARFDRPAARTGWQWLAFAPWAVAIAAAMAFAASDEPVRFALPATFAVASAGAAAGIAGWRLAWRPGLAVLPALAGSTGAALGWAWWDMPAEWLGAWIALAALGYGLVADFDRAYRASWQVTGVATGALALGVSHVTFLAVEDPRAQAFALPSAYALLAAGTAVGVARWRLQWRSGLVLLPPLIAATGGTLAWAWFEMPYQWSGAWVAAGAAGYLVIAEVDRQQRPGWQTGALGAGGLATWLAFAAAGAASPGAREEFVLPLTLGILAAAAAAGVARWRLGWRPGVATLPLLVPAAPGALAWAWLEMPLEWAAAWVALATAGYLLAAEADAAYRTAWQATALAPGATAIALAAMVIARADPGASTEFVLPLTLAILAITTAAGVARWRLGWRTGAGLLPPLTASAAGSLAWAWLEMPVEWAPAWVAAAAVGYLVIAETDSQYRSAWRTAALVPGAGAVLASWPVSAAAATGANEEFVLPLTLAVLAAGTAAGVGRWRLGWRTGIAVLPGLLVSAPGTLLWAWVDMPWTWTGAWVAAASAGYLLPAELDPRHRYAWRMTALATSAAALLVAHAGAGEDFPHPAQLPTTYAIVLAASMADAGRRRDWSLLAPPGIAAGLGATTLWAAGAGPEWWGFPAIGLALLGAAAERAWRRNDLAAAWGWAYVASLATIPALVSIDPYLDAPWNGLAAFAAAAPALGLAAWRCGGVLATPFLRTTTLARRPDRVLLAERAAFAYGAAALLLAAGGFFNRALEFQGDERSWVFLGLGAAGWLAGAATGQRSTTGPFLAVPPALTASSLAAGLAAEAPGTATIVLAVSAAMPALVFATTRFPPSWLASAVYASLAAWAGWEWAGFEEWTLPGAYAVSGALTWLGLYGMRRYGRFEAMRDTTVHLLTWAPWLVAGTIATAMVNRRSGELTAGEAIAQTQEWAMLTAVVAGAAAALTLEGFRLHNRAAQQVGTAGLLLALLFTIAIGDPANVQAYTAPIGLYLVATGLTIQRSEPFLGRHMQMHEVLIVAGALFIVLPPAEQGFEPDGAVYGFELIGIGLVFLLAGLVLHARWLVPAGVLTLTGVAVRWLTGGFVEVPYWLILGIVGTILLAAGTFILLQKERWDAWRERTREWWLQTTAGPPPAAPGHPAGQ